MLTRREAASTSHLDNGAIASTRDQSSPANSSPLRDLRARGFPRVPSLPASSLDGKEGVTCSVTRTSGVIALTPQARHADDRVRAVIDPVRAPAKRPPSATASLVVARR